LAIVVIAEANVGGGGKLGDGVAGFGDPAFVAGDQVAGDEDEVGAEAVDLLYHGADVGGGDGVADVEVGEVGDAQAVELGWEVFHRHGEFAELGPEGF